MATGDSHAGLHAPIADIQTLRLASGWAAVFSIAVLFAVSCGTAPSAPGAPTPVPRPDVAVTSIRVAGTAVSTGYRYETAVSLREQGGVAATIVSIDLVFMQGTAPIVSSHFDKPISDGANVCPASGTVTTRELETIDAEGHSYAATVVATVTFSDGNSFRSTAFATADVPALAPPQRFVLTGAITDVASHAAIAGARIEILTGTNAGKSASTDAGGVYVFDALVAETFRLRASAPGYDPGEQNVTVPNNPRADFELRRQASTPGPCSYVVTPTAPALVSWEGGEFAVTIGRMSGTCAWQATSDAGWITFPRGASGAGDGTLTYAVGSNGLNNRSGAITIAWTGGTARIAVTQGPHPDFECFVGISKGPQDFDNVAPAGGALTVLPTVSAIPAGWPCTATVSSSVSWISGGGSISGPSTMTFVVAANPSPGTTRTGSISVQTGSKTASVAVTQR